MFHSRILNNKITRLYERALRVALLDYKSPFNDLLQKDNSFTIHQKNFQTLNKTKVFLINRETAIHFEVGEPTL